MDRNSVEKSLADADVETVEGASQSPEAPSYLSSLKVWHGAFTDESIFKIFLRPFPFLLSPVVRIFCDMPVVSRIGGLTI